MNFTEMTIKELEVMRKTINKTIHEKREEQKNRAIERFRLAFEELIEYVDCITVEDFDAHILVDDFAQFNFED